MFYRILKFALCTAVILTTYGCQSTSENTNLASADDTDPYILLQKAEAAGSYRERARLRLAAAEIFAAENDARSVVETLALVDPSVRLSDAEMDTMYRLLAAAHTQLGAPDLASAALQNLSRWEGADFLALGAICQANKDPACAADALIQGSLAFGYGAEELPGDIHEQIWAALNLAPQGPSVFTHRYHHAWWLLQQSQREAGSVTARIKAWQRWKRRNPSHPAALLPPRQLLDLETYVAPHIAVALPLSGTFAMAGKAARDGFVAAYLNELDPDLRPADKPVVEFYDTARAPLEQIWQEILDSGADVVVGPLLKDTVEAFTQLTAESPLPRLALNYVDTPATSGPGKLFQIGIAIEDEATSLAQHVATRGHQNLLVVHSLANWSERAQRKFFEQWPNNATSAPFQDIKALTEAVGTAMQVASSQTRQQELVRILGQTLEFLPRARGDLDGVVALTTNTESRALVPALKFHFADHLPVYGTSQAVRQGSTDALKKLYVTEMPLFTNPEYQQLLAAFDTDKNNFSAVYALGFDAYRVATWLPVTDTTHSLTLPGASGYLWLEGDGIFHRELELHPVQAGSAAQRANDKETKPTSTGH